MTHDPAEALELATDELLSLAEFAACADLPPATVREWVQYGALQPEPSAGRSRLFARRMVVAARTAHRLQRDLELDAHALAVVMRLVERIEALEAELRHLRACTARLGSGQISGL